MPNVTIESEGKVAILRLNNGVTNAISPDLVSDLSEALATVRKEFRGMILTGNEKFLSIGFDLPRLIQLDRNGMTDFLNRFNGFLLDLYTLPLPTCCLISGHAIAGGTILALTCDYRYAGSGKKLLGLNEIKLGLPVPYLADMILRRLVSDGAANDILYGGEFMPASAAKDLGLVDGIFEEDPLGRALEKISGIADLSDAAFSAIKENRVEVLRMRYEANQRSKNEYFLDCWVSEPVQALLQEASRKF
jgi:enoyl-CoA hydratase/carnithine racemase